MVAALSEYFDFLKLLYASLPYMIRVLIMALVGTLVVIGVLKMVIGRE